MKNKNLTYKGTRVGITPAFSLETMQARRLERNLKSFDRKIATKNSVSGKLFFKSEGETMEHPV